MEGIISYEELAEFHDDTIEASINDSTKHLPCPRIQITWELAPGDWNNDAQTALWFCFYDMIFETDQCDTRYVSEIYSSDEEPKLLFHAYSPLVSHPRFVRTYDLYWTPLINCANRCIINIPPELLVFIMEDTNRLSLPCYAIWGHHFDAVENR